MNNMCLVPPHTKNIKILRLRYGSVSGVSKSLSISSFGSSYHSSVYLVPVCMFTFRHLEHVEKTVKTWSDENVSSLQACLECNYWQCFYNACQDIDELYDSISSYVSFSVDTTITRWSLLIQIKNMDN